MEAHEHASASFEVRPPCGNAHAAGRGEFATSGTTSALRSGDSDALVAHENEFSKQAVTLR
jgi:hypothetical protein